MNGVYLLHFSSPYKHAKHYVGWSKAIDKRINHHKHGTGARLPKAVIDAGLDLIIARVWEGQDKIFERRVHNYKKSYKLCPICSGEIANTRMKE